MIAAIRMFDRISFPSSSEEPPTEVPGSSTAASIEAGRHASDDDDDYDDGGDVVAGAFADGFDVVAVVVDGVDGGRALSWTDFRGFLIPRPPFPDWADCGSLGGRRRFRFSGQSACWRCRGFGALAIRNRLDCCSGRWPRWKNRGGQSRRMSCGRDWRADRRKRTFCGGHCYCCCCCYCCG